MHNSSQYAWDFSIRTTQIRYQAEAKESNKMIKVEPRQLPNKPKAPKKTKPKIKLGKANPTTEASTKN